MIYNPVIVSDDSLLYLKINMQHITKVIVGAAWTNFAMM